MTSHSKEIKTDLDIFAQNLYLLDTEIILVTTDGDKSSPGDYNSITVNKILQCDKIKSWYTQNYSDRSNKKIKSYPIGFDFHTVRDKTLDSKSKILDYMINLRKKKANKTRIDKIFCDVHLSQNERHNNERKRIFEILKGSKNIKFLEKRTNIKNIWNFYSDYTFGISTHGNGLDCHRTYEMLLLGCIVITKTSFLNELYKALPVVIVSDWNECLDENNLKLWEKKYSKLTDLKYIVKMLIWRRFIKEDNIYIQNSKQYLKQNMLDPINRHMPMTRTEYKAYIRKLTKIGAIVLSVIFLLVSVVITINCLL